MTDWWSYIFFAVAIVVLFSVIALPFSSEKFDKATLIKICRDGTPILRTKDGTIWARRSTLFAYRVEEEKSVCSQ